MSLLPCPFCGGPAVVLRGVGCRNKGCFNPQVTQDKVASADEAIAMWNRRAVIPGDVGTIGGTKI